MASKQLSPAFDGLFVFQPEAGVLRCLPDLGAVRAAVAEGEADCLFFAADGTPLRPERIGGLLHLRPWASCASCRLAQVLHQVHAVQGPEPFNSLPAIQALVA